MKATFNLKTIAVSISLMLAGAAAQAQSLPASAGIVASQISGSIAASISVNQGGFSESNAKNVQTANSAISATTQTNLNAAGAGLTGVISGTGSDQAWNYSTGNGVGSAQSAGSNTEGALGVVNVENIGVTGVPGVNLTLTGLTGDVAGAGVIETHSQDNVNASTNMGGVNATASNGTFTVGVAATSSGQGIATDNNDNGTKGASIDLSGTATGDVSASNAKGTITLQTGTDLNGNAINTTLGTATNNVLSTGNMQASFGGAAASIAGAGTITGLEGAIDPGLTQLDNPGADGSSH